MQLVGVLLYVGNSWRNYEMDARRLAAASAGAEGVSDPGVDRLGAQGDLSEIDAGQQGLQPMGYHVDEWTRTIHVQSAKGVALGGWEGHGLE